ncbi:response regulator [Pantanalinema sp. GBBB05]|uniref:response regulator n=1 Tax=Pantanalinema sp. GBBB05 TaxID=2604139 RepID=UPI001DE132C0|nr:response regulator transcription factor [Pantanalinema sp. GBBB05]
MSPIQVLIVDNHALVRAGFRSLLQSINAIDVIAEAGDGREALRLVELHQPDIVLMDIAMPLMNGLEATAQITQDFPQVHVIILSMHANEEYVYQALRAGATGYVLKDSGTSELELAIQAIARGETYLSPTVSKYIVADYVRRTGSEANPLEQLTPRQREILQLIAEGKSTKEIADNLYISTKTVETHRVQLMERLDIHDVAGLVRYAIRKGLVMLEE